MCISGPELAAGMICVFFGGVVAVLIKRMIENLSDRRQKKRNLAKVLAPVHARLLPVFARMETDYQSRTAILETPHNVWIRVLQICDRMATIYQYAIFAYYDPDIDALWVAGRWCDVVSGNQGPIEDDQLSNLFAGTFFKRCEEGATVFVRSIDPASDSVGEIEFRNDLEIQRFLEDVLGLDLADSAREYREIVMSSR